MKLLLPLAAATLLLAAPAARLRAQTPPGSVPGTVLPSGAVAPTGAVVPTTGEIITPGTVPGASPVVTPGMRDAGSRRARRRDEKIPGLSPQGRKELRQLRKVRAIPTDDGKIRKQ